MPMEKRWGHAQERDLAIAIIFAQAGDRPKYNWEKITEIMTGWGHGFTRDAVNQHWSKRIMKEFKDRHGAAAAKSGLASPKESDADAAAPGAGKRRRGKAKKQISAENLDIKGAPEDESPTKKTKTEVEPKEEEEGF